MQDSARKHCAFCLLIGLTAALTGPALSLAGNIVFLDRIPQSREGLAAGPGGLLYGIGYNVPSVFTLNPGTDAFNEQATSLTVSSTLINVGGIFYGVTLGGTIFSFNPVTNVTTSLANAGDNARPFPVVDLTTDGQGNIYGVTSLGGQYNGGSVFEFDTNTDTLTTLGSFQDPNGHYPSSPPVLGSNGKIYGTTQGGGSGNGGTFYELDPSTGDITTLGSFTTATGTQPIGELVADSQGNLYGVTWNGGGNDDGTIFEANPDTGNISPLASFGGIYGSHPEAGLIADAAGDFFGTTNTGVGQLGVSGTVFEYDSNTGQLTMVATSGGLVNIDPQAVLVADSQGNLYGTTFGGFLFEVTGSGFVVPEPSTLALLGVAACAVMARRNRRRDVSLDV